MSKPGGRLTNLLLVSCFLLPIVALQRVLFVKASAYGNWDVPIVPYAVWQTRNFLLSLFKDRFRGVGENSMKTIKKIAIAAFASALTFTAWAQEDGPAGFTYGTYYVCDVASQGDMDTIVEQYEKPVFDQWVEDGKMTGWGYYSHFTGGRWRRLQWHGAPTLNEAVNNQAAIFQEIYADNADAGARRSEACETHDDYVWADSQFSGPPTESGMVSLSVYYVCDQARETEADEIVRNIYAPLYEQLMEDGKLVGWGWSTHVLGGEIRRLGTAIGTSYSQVLDARAAVIEATQDNSASTAFVEICTSHSDYLWDIVH